MGIVWGTGVRRVYVGVVFERWVKSAGSHFSANRLIGQ